MQRTYAIAILTAALVSSATAQTIGDPAAGKRLAAAWCSECHAITGDSAGATLRGPSFLAIAKRPKTTPLSLNVFLRSSHDTMPNLILKRDEADDIVAYIVSLKGD